MTTSKLRDWLEIVGLFAVVASLIFVGLQMKQSQEIAIASQYQSRAEAVLDFHTIGMESGMSMAYFDMTPVEQWPPEKFHYWVSVKLWGWINLDNNHYQFEAGFMTEESWLTYRQQIASSYAECSARWIYETFRKPKARESFTKLIDSLPDPCSPEDKLPPWERDSRSFTGENQETRGPL